MDHDVARIIADVPPRSRPAIVKRALGRTKMEERVKIACGLVILYGVRPSGAARAQKLARQNVSRALHRLRPLVKAEHKVYLEGLTKKVTR